jgi:SAM-dependent methyltransferase
MVHRKVFNKIGLLNEEYGVGGGEDTEFCIEAERVGFEVSLCMDITWSEESSMYTGSFPIYHKGEGTMHDPELVPEWNDIFLTNSLKLAKKYNYEWYRWRLSDYCERGVFLQGDPVFPRETTRYKWAAENMVGTRLFELGCSSGYGVQFLPENVMYTGLDYGKFIIQAAKEQNWKRNTSFIHADVNTHELDQYDTIVAFEVIEHLDNGLEIVEKLKKYCKRLMISVPYMENSNSENYHHKLHMLTEINFPGFKFKYINEAGDLLDEPENRGDLENINLMLCIWDNPDNNLRSRGI